ncbi:unnamed protein product [Brachionus calyciflorus]|uniref:CCHC-type domain-containing protein n=1 Tax=Brachionus calyciflorus TaxID=104777 RepID=A0A814FVR2_9BILA|nr:unnamed protein product [Brachionus calyciflorus]
MSEKPENADIFFAGSKSVFKVKLRNKPYLYKHKKDQKYKSDHKQGSSKLKDKKKIVCYGCDSEGHYINQCYKINNGSIEKKDKNNKRTKSERRDKRLNTAKKLGLSILPSDKSINTADGSTNKVIGVTEEIELKVAETVDYLSFIITNVSHIEVLLGLDWFDQTKVVLDPARRVLKIPGKNIKLDSVEESDFETEINAYLADQEPDDIFSDEIIDCDSKLELKQTNLKVLDDLLKQNEDVFAKSLKECKNDKFDIETTTETPVMPNPYKQANSVNEELRAEVKK